MLAGRVSLLSSGPGERALARWPALVAEASKGAEAGKEGGAKEDNNNTALVAAVGGNIERWLLQRAQWLDGAFAQASERTTRSHSYPASYVA